MTKLRPIHRLAIVNRGEAAMRCIRGVKALRAAGGGFIHALALYTDVDRDAPFVRHADESFRLDSEGDPVAAYLDHDRLIANLRRIEADAVWPGWGFVAEDPDFVDRLAVEGIVFLGPSADSMRTLGDKIAAKQLAESAGIPVTSWSKGPVENVVEARAAANRIGFPLVIKAAAGGGGRGIRMLDGFEGFDAAYQSATSEARNAFGDGRIFLESKVRGGRHVEVQIAADGYGHVIAIGCRDCSVQRRHQKILEESPPPGLSRALQDDIVAAAIGLAAKVGYCGLGTVEFLVTDSEFTFLEMNPRLQVEHGVTEVVTGIDLVQLQIRIAQGERLPTRGYEQHGCAIEARLCAEDPDAGFLPAPGRIARFDPSLGPQVRVDSGVVSGSSVPAAFDSLIAKVIAWGDTREEARARLACALADFEVVIEGGATNKGYLIELLDTPEFREGGVDTGWLDRLDPRESERRQYAVESLVVAAILAYQRARHTARLNFFSDPSNASPTSVPASEGQQIDLTYRNVSHRLRVFAVGSWNYRVHLDGRVVSARLMEERPHSASLVMGNQTFRVLYDASDSGLRVEVEGRPHRFDLQTAGQVRSGTPSMVVAIQVAAGDSVEAGQPIGLLEAMKIEIAIDAPVSGTVKEVLVRKGQQVAAGDVLLVIEPRSDDQPGSGVAAQLVLPIEPDPLDLFYSQIDAESGPSVDFTALESLDAPLRHAAIATLRRELRRLILGYDANPARGQMLLGLLEAPLPEGLGTSLRTELAELRHELVVFANVEQLFIRAPRASVSGTRGPSNSARMRMYVRRMRAEGAGIAEEFLALLRRTLGHYGVSSLRHDAALERAVLRLFASQRAPALRRRLVMELVRWVVGLARSGTEIGHDAELADALARIAGMRGLVPDALADAVTEARYTLFDGPEVERRLDHSTTRLARWIADAEAHAVETPHAPEDVLLELADAPRRVFDRVGRWLSDPEPRRRAAALGAYLRRLYSPVIATRHESHREGEAAIDLMVLSDGRTVIGGEAAEDSLAATAQQLCEFAGNREGNGSIDAIELFVATESSQLVPRVEQSLLDVLESGLPARTFTLTHARARGPDLHCTYEPSPAGIVTRRDLYHLHPETARRIDFQRLSGFELEPIPGADGIHSFYGRARDLPDDERIFVLAEVRGRAIGADYEAALHVPAFERAFSEATRTLRAILAERDERRRLQWNRIAVFVAPEIYLDREMATRLSRKLAPATRHLGLDRVLVRLNLIDREHPTRPARGVEIVITDPTGSRMEISWREPRHAPLVPVGSYERKVVEARRRGHVYPYEIVRMLTGSAATTGAEPLSPGLPGSIFEEYDLDPGASAPRALRVAHRSYGQNTSGIVFGIISTPTEKIREGMRRVLILSDPTRGMGSLSGPECDRVVAAIDLAEQMNLPVEWVPVSSGARIAMDSGTENLDATARVVRRIVHFTQAGGVIHVIVSGVNVGAQSYWNALATMLLHTHGVLIMTPAASMVLTGRAALEASGAVAAEDEAGIGGFERVMGPNGEAQYFASDLGDAYRILYQHYQYTYVVPGEAGPRRLESQDPIGRNVLDYACNFDETGDFDSLREIFDEASNPDRKRPFPMRTVMRAVIDQDGGFLERWESLAGGETAIVWDAHLGGYPVCMIGIESRSVDRQGYRPPDGPSSWTGATLFPLSSKKVARALNAASGNRPVLILANLSGFDGSPESMRKLQLEYGAEIARAVVNFEGPLLFLVVSRYHGGAYVVFSKALNEQLRASALTGSFASVIGGGPAAAVVFSREVRARASADPRVVELREQVRRDPNGDASERLDEIFREVLLEKQAEMAAEFDAVHTVERARDVGSLDEIIAPEAMRPFLASQLARAGEVGGAPRESSLSKFRRDEDES